MPKPINQSGKKITFNNAMELYILRTNFMVEFFSTKFRYFLKIKIEDFKTSVAVLVFLEIHYLSNPNAELMSNFTNM